MISVKENQVLIERLNQAVYAAVMDTRGMYMSKDAPAAEPYAKGLLGWLKTVAEVSETLDKTSPFMSAEEKADLKKRSREFVELRTGQVTTLRERGLAEARVIGDNDANRNNRKAFNDTIKQVSARFDGLAHAQKAQAETLQSRLQTTLVIVGLVPVLGMLAGMLLVSNGITKPLGRMRASIVGMAQGNLSTAVYGSDRADELGDIGQAVEEFPHTHSRRRARAGGRRGSPEGGRGAREGGTRPGHRARA